MSIPEMNHAAIASASSLHSVKISEPKPEVKNTDSTENRNLHLARQVEEHKNKLIKVLSKIPATAYWLVTKYDQSVDETEMDEEASVPHEIDDSIKNIKILFQNLVELESTYISTEKKLIASQKLTAGVEQFPFAFDDLITLVDLVVFGFKLLDTEISGDNELTKKDNEIIAKRIDKKSSRLNKTFLKQFASLGLENTNNLFLFGNLDELKIRLIDSVLSEYHWLQVRQQLASANSKLVLFIANQYKGNFLDFEDLVQEGNTGLLKAVDRFKYQLGFQFSTYAGYWIRQAISRALSRSERVVRIPCGQIATINKVFRAKDELTLKLGRDPDNQALADHTGLSRVEINNIFSISQTAVPLESFDDDEEESYAPIDFLEQKVFTHTSDMIAESQLEKIVNSAIKTLNPREAKIITSHFGVGTDSQKTLQEIGCELNLTRERIRQIQVVALNKIRHRYGEQLFSFL